MIQFKLKPMGMLLTALLWVGALQAQESVHTAGGNSSGAGGTAAYSIGQVVYTNNAGSTGAVDQGVQHAYELITVDMQDVKSDYAITLFPNPATDYISLQVGNFGEENLYYELHDMQGKMIGRQQLIHPQTEIPFAGLASASYFIRVVNQSNQPIQSFQIIKK